MPAVLVPIESGKPIVLDKPIVLVGRHPDCDAVILNSRKISRKHCAVALVNNNFVVRDLGSMNGIWVNGERVEHQSPVRFGDELMIGDVRFTLEADKPGAAKPKPAPGKAREQVIPTKPVADAKPHRKKPMISPPQSEMSMEFPVPIDDDDGFNVPPPAEKAVGSSTDGEGDDVIPLKADKPGAGKSKPASNKSPTPVAPLKLATAEVKPARQQVMVSPPQLELSMEFAVPIGDDEDDGLAVAAPAPAPVPVIPAKPAVVDVAPATADAKPAIAEAMPAPQQAIVTPPQSEPSMELAVPIDDEDDAVAVLSAVENVASTNGDGEDVSPLKADESGTGKSILASDEVPASVVSAMPPAADVKPAPQIAIITPPQPVLRVEVPEPIIDKKEDSPVVPLPPKRDLGSYTFVEGDDFIADSGSFDAPAPAEKVADTVEAKSSSQKKNEPPVASPPPPKRDPGTFTYVEGDDFIEG